MIRNVDIIPYQGLSRVKGRYIPTGIDTIDYALNDLAPARVTLVVGRANSGKTVLIKQVVANAITFNNKVLLINGENDPESWLNELYQCVIGRNNELYTNKKLNKRWHKEPKPEVLDRLKKWHEGKLSMYSSMDNDLKSMEDLFTLMELEINLNKHNLVIIDNLMSILIAKSSEKYEAQADFMQKCCDIAKRTNTHIVLVLHPNKQYQVGQEMVFENISGTLDLPNKADNIIAVIREYDEEKIASGINGQIMVLKNRYYGDLPKVITSFELETGLLLENGSMGIIEYDFGLDDYLYADERIQMPFDLGEI